MKKRLTWLAAMALCLCLLTGAVFAGEFVPVHVAIAAAGEIGLAWEPVYATDRDTDGIISISDALFCAHEQAYPGGASAGYATEESQYGTSLTRLWGIENGGSYGYYVNCNPAMSLADPVAAGDAIYAFAYQDLETWSDVFSYFNHGLVYTTVNQPLDLYLTTLGYDANWEPTTAPCANAELYLQASDISPVYMNTNGVTDADGHIALAFLKAGRYVLTARSNTQLLAPPACVVYVSEEPLSLADYLAQALQGLQSAVLTDKTVFTRQLLVESLYSLAGSPSVTGESPFSDVTNNNSAVLWAYQTGLVQGYGDGTFGGSNPLTRQQLAVILDRYLTTALGLELPTADLSVYTDADAVADWAVEAVGHMAALGLWQGDTLRPQDPFTLGNVAA